MGSELYSSFRHKASNVGARKESAGIFPTGREMLSITACQHFSTAPNGSIYLFDCSWNLSNSRLLKTLMQKVKFYEALIPIDYKGPPLPEQNDPPQ
jgi:hypothetical protein